MRRGITIENKRGEEKPGYRHKKVPQSLVNLGFAGTFCLEMSSRLRRVTLAVSMKGKLLWVRYKVRIDNSTKIPRKKFYGEKIAEYI